MMTKTGFFLWRRISLAFALTAFLIGLQGQAFAVSKCQETTNNGKYWEYRDFLINAGADGKGKKGLAKGNNNVNGDGVNEALNSYLRKAAGWTTTEHVTNIENLKSQLDGFDGAPGLLGYVWLEIAKKAMAHYNKQTLDKNDKIDIDVWGRINENNTAPNDNENGYYYNKNERSGHIWATMCFEIRFSGTGPNQDPDAKVRYALKTEVAKCGFKEISRGNGTGNAQIFIGSYMPWFANNNNLNGFLTKLEAVNFLKGDTPSGGDCPTPANGYVTVGAAFFDKDGDGTWANYSTHAHLFNPNPQACVDMFFPVAAADLPASFDNNSQRPNYCLGRCSDPPIANSGM